MTTKFSNSAFVGLVMLAANFWSYPANALTFHFSFDNFGNGGGIVDGTISGLVDNSTTSATSVFITSNTAGYGVGEYVGSPLFNAFTVTAGAVTTADFFSRGALNSSPAVTCCSFIFQTLAFIIVGLHDDSDNLTPLTAQTPDLTHITFALVSETPLPAALPLFATGLGALGLLGWRRKRNQTA